MKKQLLSTALSSLLCFSVQADIAPAPTTTEIPAAPTPTATPAVPAAPKPETVIDCHYAIPATTTAIDQTILSTWASKAAVQAFDFHPTTMAVELESLKSCFTPQGWQGYYDALVKSGNIESIKTNGLTVKSQIDGALKIDAVKDGQWKITLPMTVVYQNDKESFKQALSVELLVGRNVSGSLGIMQVIASPKDTMPASSPQAPTTTVPQ